MPLVRPLRKNLGRQSEMASPFHTPSEFLTAYEEQRLAMRWRTMKDEGALHRLIAAYRPLVKKIASEFRSAGPSLEDLLQEGYLGLTIAVRRFEPQRNVRIGTYAAYWIRSCILEFVVRSCGPVRIGTTHRQRRIFFGLSSARRLLERQAIAPDRENLARVLQADEQEVEAMAIRLSKSDVCLDAAIPTSSSHAPHLQLVDDGLTPEDAVAVHEGTKLRQQQLAQSLSALSDRERAILSQRYLQMPAATLAELGSHFRVSQERIRQIESAALKKLRRTLVTE